MSDTTVVVLTPEQLKTLMREAIREERERHAGEGLAEVLTREQAAELLQIHPQVVTRFVREKGLPGHKLGSDWRFRRTELLQWLDRQPKDLQKVV